jgi:hypothetical protein
MCHFKTLYYNDKDGYIIICEQCRKFQLGFGCVLINFNYAELRSFHKEISELIEDYDGLPLSNTKSIWIPTPCDGLSLYLSITELRMLYTMLEEAEVNLCVKELMKLFA